MALVAGPCGASRFGGDLWLVGGPGFESRLSEVCLESLDEGVAMIAEQCQQAFQLFPSPFERPGAARFEARADPVDGGGNDTHGAGAVRFDTKVEGGPLGEGGERYYNYVRLVRDI